MTDLLSYDRSAHNAACPCNDCTAYDAALFHQENPNSAAAWRPNGAADWIAAERKRNLNWNLEPGHCILCGGTSAHINDQMEHYQILRHNTKILTSVPPSFNDQWFTSLMLHKAGSLIAVYRRIFTTKPILIDWSCLILELNPEKCFAVASREHEEWLEIRLGFWELQDENWDQRVRRRTSPRSGKDGASFDPSTRSGSGEVQGVLAVAR